MDSFEKSLNLNLNYYIENKKGELSKSQLKDLLCKFIYNFYGIVNIGVYKKEKCIGKGSTGRVNNFYLQLFLL